MFKYPFSFDERIRRKEYGLSFLIVMLAQAIISAVSDSMHSEKIELAVIPVFYFLFAQGAKRCHDRGVNGWYQFLPFYFLVLTFVDGVPGENEYGPNPKEAERSNKQTDYIDIP